MPVFHRGLQGLAIAALVMVGGNAHAEPSCDALAAALAGDRAEFSTQMQETFTFLDAKSCDFETKSRFVCMADFDRMDATKLFGAFTFEAIVTGAGSAFVRCGAELDTSASDDDVLLVILAVPVGKRIAKVKLEASLWEADPDDITLDIEVK